jgi:4-hydroxy-4-methyl-2-oxoglutarate aldolase
VTARPIDPVWHQVQAAFVSDALDSIGLMDQAMRASIRPVDEQKTLVGRARTGIYMEVAHIPAGSNPYEVEIAFVDDLRPGDVAILACGGSARIAPWGSLLSTASAMRGATGCVTDGLVRDVLGIRELAFPVFHGGIGPLDSKGRGKMIERDVPVICGGVAISPGDIIIGDADGVVVVPQAVESRIVALLAEKIAGESNTLAALRAGDYLRDVYARYGVL